MVESRGPFNILTDKPSGKIPLGRPRRSWEDNRRMDPREIDINTRNLGRNRKDSSIRDVEMSKLHLLHESHFGAQFSLIKNYPSVTLVHPSISSGNPVSPEYRPVILLG